MRVDVSLAAFRVFSLPYAQPLTEPSNDPRNEILYGPIVNRSSGLQHADEQFRRERTWWRSMYNRLSQSEAVSVLERQPLETSPRRRQSLRKSTHRLASVEVSTQAYDDLPPTSVIRSYRESRTRTPQNDVAQPLLHEAPCNSSTVFSPIQHHAATNSTELEGVPRAPLTTVYELGASPVNSATSLPSRSSRTDSFLGRAFAAQSDGSFSTDSLTAGATSNQSHHANVRLTVGPEPVASSKRMVYSGI